MNESGYSGVFGNFSTVQAFIELQEEKQQMSEPKGLKYDGDKITPELLSPIALTVASRILAKGKRKYSARNWELGFNWSRSIGGGLRHIIRRMLGQTHDIGQKKYGDSEDCAECVKGTLESMDWVCKVHTGELHSGCAMVNMMFVIHFEKTKPEYNDLPDYEVK